MKSVIVLAMLFIAAACDTQPPSEPGGLQQESLTAVTTASCGGSGAGLCSRDTDCRLQANYCDGCECVALNPGESLPKCTGTPVQCFVDPCRGHEARCELGRCVDSNGALTQ